MVKLISLYASNFKKLNFDSPLKFKDGITVISGLNEAGKSTVLDAILYALYGKVMRPPGHVKDEDLLGYGANKATLWLEFSTDAKSFKVVREIRRNGTNNAFLDELLPGDSSRALARKSREVTAAIKRLLSDISFEEMISSNVVAQKDLNRLVEKGSDRSEVINAFLHLESFNKAIEDLDDQRKDLEGTGPNRPGIIRTEQERLVQLKRDFEEYEQRKNQNETLAKEIENAQIDLSKLEPRYKELDELLGQLTEYDKAFSLQQKLLDDTKNKQKLLDNHKETISNLSKQIEGFKREAREYSDLPSPEVISKVRELALGVRNTGTQVDTLRKSAESKANELKALGKEIEAYDKDSVLKTKQSKVSLRTYAGGTLAAFFALVAALVFSIPILPWVLAAIAVIFLILLARNISRMNRLLTLQKVAGKFDVYAAREKDLAELQGQRSAAGRDEESQKNELQAAISSLPRYMEFASGKTPLERSDAIIKRYDDEKPKQNAIDAKLEGTGRTLKDQNAQLDQAAAEQEIRGLRRAVNEIVLPMLPSGVNFTKELSGQVGGDKEELAKKISGARTLIDTNGRTIEANNAYLSQHADIEPRMKNQEALIETKSRELRVVKAAVDGIEKTAASRRTMFRPGVESYMDEILPSITSGRYKAVLLDEDFGVQVFDPEAGEYRPKDVFSGGTEDQFLLAMRLAFALALVPEAKGTILQFLWLDEPLGSSDEIRRSGIIGYLNTILSKRFSQIFIVSHVGGLEEQVPNVVRLENGKFQV